MMPAVPQEWARRQAAQRKDEAKPKPKPKPKGKPAKSAGTE